MKALTLRQPWARAVVTGVKRIETRSWRTNYRGRLLIHAASTFGRAEQLVELRLMSEGILPILSSVQLGGIVGSVELVDCLPVEEVRGKLSRIELALGDYGPGRFAWTLSDARLKVFRPCSGSLGLWNFKT